MLENAEVARSNVEQGEIPSSSGVRRVVDNKVEQNEQCRRRQYAQDTRYLTGQISSLDLDATLPRGAANAQRDAH